MMTRGVVTVAYGDRAQAAADQLLASVADHTDLETMVVDEGTLPDMAGATPGRWAKLNLNHLSPFEQTLYLDADTLVLSADVMRGFALIDGGWDMAIAASRQDEWLGHVEQVERDASLVALGWQPLQLQAGVMFFTKSAGIARLFGAWRAEWRRFQREDQGALLRALYVNPVRVRLLPPEFNGGAIVEHRFGELRA